MVRVGAGFGKNRTAPAIAVLNKIVFELPAEHALAEREHASHEPLGHTLLRYIAIVRHCMILGYLLRQICIVGIDSTS
ncbi:hypothetical protein CTI12_AA023880 [Artemisia annua]|uniref:Uncharacterized protein n=1 Tax=Artemisia annua TaxID=35608 RepID=A0A2U1QJ47_ARTAN|nr:hypothetical protein CTI12_AA023880 [Artemisia annua]